MPETEKDTGRKRNSEEFISVIYNQKNDSPKYFELKKSRILLFVIGLPTLTLVALILGAVGLVHTSPFHLIDTYRQNTRAREAVAKTNALIREIQTKEDEKAALTQKLAEVEAQLMAQAPSPEGAPASDSVPTDKATTPTAQPCPPSAAKGAIVASAGVPALSLFVPVAGQKDRTKPATLNLTGFKVVENRDMTNLQFNIIPIGGENKLAGHIIVLMKNELTIQAYPDQALRGSDTQINYLSGEPFATQRFRPVNAGFLKPRKPGNYTFSVYIFAKNGDLIHFQSVVMPVKF